MTMPAGWIYDVDEGTFGQAVIDASAATPVLVDFWADWCGPCHALTPALERVIGEFQGRVRLAKVDADENMKLAGRYQLRGFPTVLLFHRGELVDRFSGAQRPEFIRNFIQSGVPGLDAA